MGRQYLFCLLPFVSICITVAANCPEPGQPEWKTKDSNCKQQDSTKRYHCQNHADLMELCAVPVDCTPGTHAKLDQSAKTVSCVKCSPDTYQPTVKPSYKFTQPNCDAQCKEGEVSTSNFSCITHAHTNTGLSGRTLIGVIVGAVVGVIALIAIVVVVIYFVVVRRRKKHTLTKDPEEQTERKEPLIEVTVQEENEGGKEASPETPLVPTEGGDKEPEKPGLLSEASPETPLIPSEVGDKVPEIPEDDLYNKVKVMFVESVNPNDLVSRVNLNSNDEDRITELTKREGKEAGAGLLLQTVKKVYPDDWFERIIPALKEPNVGLEHLAEKMEQMKQEK